MLTGGETRVDGQLLDAQAQLMVRLVSLKYPKVHETDPETLRALMTDFKTRGPAVPRLCPTEAHSVVVGDHALQTRVYRPPQPTGGALVYFHGGGWVVGDLDSHEAVCQQLAHHARTVVISVAYRLAPEHPFPAAFDDALGAFRALREQAWDLGVDPTRLAVGGDSAGGNLAAAICHALRGEVDAPVFQLLVYPATDLSRESASYEHFAEGFFLSRDAMRWFIEHYTDPEERTDPRVSPLLSQEFEGLPPACVVVAGFDPLRDEALAYAQRLKGAGVSTRTLMYPSQFHGFFSNGHLLIGGERAVKEAAAVLRDAMMA